MFPTKFKASSLRLLLFTVLLFSSNFLNAQQQQPNILLIMSDDLNTRIGPYMGIDEHTPNLDQLAQKGVRFQRAYCQYPICGPSRASLMSGLYPETNGVLGNSTQLGSYKLATPQLADHPSMAGFFRENGYYSARVSKIYHMGVPGGIERGDAGGDEPDSWDYAYNVMGPETMSPGELELLSPKNLHYGSNFARLIVPDRLEQTQTDYIATSQAIAILENRINPVAPGGTNLQRIKPDAPFFLAVGLVRPHVPLVAPERCFLPYPEAEVELPPTRFDDDVPEQALRRQNDKVWGMSKQQQKKVISSYMASVRFMDEQVGRLLDALERLGARDNTIVIFVSDHGYNLGQHDCWSKVSLWEGSLRVPMIISDPSRPTSHGTQANSVVELIDLYPTLLDLSGFSDQKPNILQGKSLLPMIEGGQTVSSENEFAYSVSYGGKDGAITTERWKYTRWEPEIKKGNEELYDHQNDPEEYNNLANDPAHLDVLKRLRQQYDQVRQQAQNALGQ